MTSSHYNVFIVGTGILGGGVVWPLASCTNIKRVGMADKADHVAAVASSAHGNSQTPHNGAQESNYSIQKTLEAQRAVRRMENFARRHGLLKRLMPVMSHLTLGVGETEMALLRQRHEELHEYYPDLEIFDRDALKELEPAVVYDSRGLERPEPILAIGTRASHSAINFATLTEELITRAQAMPGKTVDVHLNTKVKSIERKGDIFEIHCEDNTFSADFVVVNAGAHSLLMAHRMGYGLDLACLPIAGGFYMADCRILNGKVYTIQDPKLPFAALHGDPDVMNACKTRFGPTALFMPMLEPEFGLSTFFDAVEAMNLDRTVVQVLGGLMMDSTIRNFVINNLIYRLPYIGKRRILEDLRRIVPGLQLDDIEVACGYGGIRPQIIDKKKKELLLGDGSLHESSIIFHMTPSPGATRGIDIGVNDTRYIAKILGLELNEEKLEQELGAA